jgi:hypothetical protein
MNRNEIKQGLTVRVRPTSRSHNYGGYSIGRTVSSQVGTKRVGYSGRTAATVDVEWYATVNQDGIVRVWDAPRLAEKTDARSLEVIDVDKLAAELREASNLRQARYRQEQEQADETEANLAVIRTALGDESWGTARYNGSQITIYDNQLAALVAFVSKVVAS